MRCSKRIYFDDSLSITITKLFGSFYFPFLQFEFKLSNTQKYMAFVFRSKPNTLTISPSPGPGKYQYEDKGKETHLSTVPFNQSTPRRLWKENTIPGPGAYQSEQHKSNCKAIIKNCGNAYAIYESPNESSIFKSTSKRFLKNEQGNPGPGQYSFEIEKTSKERTASQANSLHKYLQKSRIHNGPQREVGLLAIGEEEQANRQSTVQSCHLKKSDKKAVPFQTCEQRSKPLRPQTSLGPGSYELNRVKEEKEQLNRKKVSQSIIKFKKVPVECKQDLQIAVIEKVDEKKFVKKSFNHKKDDFFGSSVSRFNSACRERSPGPGEYESQINKPTSCTAMPIKKPAFGRSSQDIQIREVFISPWKAVGCKEQPKKQNRKKLTEGCFVFKQPRFKEIKTTISTDAMSTELFLGKENKEKQCETKKISNKYHPKLLIKREITKNTDLDDRPLSYAADAYTIAYKNKQKCQINAPFLSYVTRFNQNTNSSLDVVYCQSTIATESKDRESSSNLKKSLSSKGIMDSKNPRFNYKQTSSQLSPFTYNPAKPVNKEFNKLFL